MRIVVQVVMLLTLGAVSAVAQEAALYPVEDCGRFTTQMDMNKCAGTNLEAANVALNKIYQQVMAEQGDTSSKEQLKNVERAWIAYRDKECAFEVGPQKGRRFDLADGNEQFPRANDRRTNSRAEQAARVHSRRERLQSALEHDAEDLARRSVTASSDKCGVCRSSQWSEGQSPAP
jgi:uncharacterized protein YecT (DUF1311 family)